MPPSLYTATPMGRLLQCVAAHRIEELVFLGSTFTQTWRSSRHDEHLSPFLLSYAIWQNWSRIAKTKVSQVPWAKPI